MARNEEINQRYVYQLISNNVKRLRSLHNISQLSLALNAGLTHNFINDIENCKKGVSANTLAKLSNALNVEPYQFFLPEGLPNDDVTLYVNDINNSLQKTINDLAEQYLRGDRNR